MVSITDIILVSSYSLLLFLSTFWLIVLFSSDEKHTGKDKTLKRTASFSVIIPVYNEEKSVLATLESLIALDYPKELLSLLVVNDGSTDSTRELVESFISKHPQVTIKIINQKNQGKGAAMNRGLKEIQSEFFACLDADSFVTPQALKRMLVYFESDPNIAAVCPLLKVQKPQSTIEKVQWYEYIINMFYRFLNARLHCVHVTPGPFSIYRTSIIKELGGYDESTITEDLEIALRLQKHHYKIIHCFDAEVETIAPQTWKALFRQRVRWYKGGVDNSVRYRKLMFNKQYGDFGMIRMPTISLSGALVLILSATMIQEIVKTSIEWFAAMKAINFDIFTLLRHISIQINLLSLPYFKIFIAGTLFAISFFVMIYSHKIINEKITNYGKTWVALFTYTAVYGLFIAGVWIYIAYMFIAKKSNFWH